MISLLFLIPLSLLVLVLAIGLFFWAVRSGQYDDIDSIAMHVLLDDDRQPPTINNTPLWVAPDSQKSQDKLDSDNLAD